MLTTYLLHYGAGVALSPMAVPAFTHILMISFKLANGEPVPE